MAWRIVPSGRSVAAVRPRPPSARRRRDFAADSPVPIDVISEGRLIIGLGAGWNQEESDALGIELPPLKERFDRFEEGVAVIVELLTKDRASFAGRHFTLREAWCEPKPV